jgi:hypothetical protein
LFGLIGFYLVYFILLESRLRKYQGWAAALDEIETSASQALEKLPVEDYKDDQAWGRSSRAASLELNALFSQAASALSDSQPAGGELMLSPRTGEDPVQGYLLERLELLQRLVRAHYPFPLGAVDRQALAGMCQFARLSWSFFLGVPLMTAGLASLGLIIFQPDYSSLFLISYAVAVVVCGLGAAVCIGRRNLLAGELGRLSSRIQALEQYAAVPFQDRVQMDMSMALMSNISQRSQELNHALQRHSRAVDAIPANIASQVSSQVKTGLDPVRTEIEFLRKALTESYGAMSGTLAETAAHLVTLIDRIGVGDQYSTWTECLAGSSASFAALASTLGKYQTQTEGIYTTLGGLCKSLENAQVQIEKSNQEIASSVTQRTYFEEMARNELSDTIRSQMSLLLNEQAQFNQTLNEMTIQVRESQNLYHELAKSIPETLKGLADASGKLQDTSHTMDGLPLIFKESLVELNRQNQSYVSHLGEGLATIQQQHTQFLGKVNESAVSLARTLDRFDQEIGVHVNHLHEHFERLEGTRLSLAQAQMESMRKMAAEVDRFAASMRSYQDEIQRSREKSQAAQQAAVQELRDEGNRFLARSENRSIKS